MADPLIPKINLTQEQWTAYKNATFAKESAASGGWQAIGGYGKAYIGGYQVGSMGLEDAGYLRENSSKGNPYAWQNDRNWLKPNGEPITPGIYNYQDFLNSPEAQNDALLKYTQKNAGYLTSSKVIDNDMAAPQRAGYLAAAHLIGAGDLAKYGLNGKDGWQTTARSRYDYIGKAVGGGMEVPPPPETSTPGASGSTTAPFGQAGSYNSDGFGTNTGSNNPLYSSSSISNSDLTSNYTNTVVSSTATSGQQIALPIPNPLNDFVSFNYLFTFSSLNASAVNFPEGSYRRGDLGLIIFSSGGRYSEERIPTAYETTDNPAGKFDYFIDNVEMLTTMAPSEETKGTRAVTISFEVTEPYSMGQFLQSCQLAAIKNGHADYTKSPYLLTLEFAGHDINNKSIKMTEATRYFPIRIVSNNMTITSGGCRYKILAQAWTDQSFNDDYNILKQDTTISGETVVEMLQSGENSLQQVVNDRLAKISRQDANKTYIPDEIAIVFPKEVATAGASQPRSATSSASTGGSSSITSKLALSRDDKTKLLVQSAGEVGPLGKSSLGFDAARGGTTQALPDTPIQVKNIPNKKFPRNAYQVNHKKASFSFRKDTSIVNAITEVMLMSEYCTKAATTDPKDPQGFYDWFKIESQVYMLTPDSGNANAGIQPLLLVYRVIPYKVHSSRFASPNVTPKGYKEMANETVKEYNYIYTGKNIDVLEFNLALDNNFGSNWLADGLGSYSAAALLSKQAKTGAAPSQIAPYVVSPDAPTTGKGGGDPATGTARQRAMPTAWKNSDGAGNADNYMTLVAKVFHYRILNARNEKVKAELTILGDPYYLSDSGVGNWSNTRSTSRMNLTDTGSIDYEGREVDIMFNFFTPVDLNSDTGGLTFASSIDNQLEIPFSGLYGVITVTSKFQKGKFTQTLLLARRPNQSMLGDNASEQISNIENTTAFKSDTLPDNAPVTKKPSGAVASPDSFQWDGLDAKYRDGQADSSPVSSSDVSDIGLA